MELGPPNQWTSGSLMLGQVPGVEARRMGQIGQERRGGRGLKPEALDGQRRDLMQSARTTPWVRAGEAQFLKTRTPALLILAPWVLEEFPQEVSLALETSPRGSATESTEV